MDLQVPKYFIQELIEVSEHSMEEPVKHLEYSMEHFL